MDKKVKTILGIIIFVVFMGGSYFTYNYLSEKYKPNSGVEKVSETKEQVKAIAAPDFTVIDNEGKKVKLSDFKGKPVVLNFWASWCPPCKREMPHFNKIYEQVKKDIVFIMVDLVDGQRETVEKGKAYIKDNKYDLPVYFDTEGQAGNNYAISSIPSTFFINKAGEVVNAYQGGIDENTLLKELAFIKE